MYQQDRASLILIRGLPGAGKSTLAQHLSAKLGFQHFEADMFFIDEQGRYTFDVNHLSVAHGWCQRATRDALKRGERVIVSNTFVQKWEIEPYVKMARQCGKKIEIIEVNGGFGSIHDVPETTIKAMKRKWYSIPKSWKHFVKHTFYTHEQTDA
ncbi:ATP-binding protein [Vibrio astriarenae]|uniref:ATP-binding protein n=1 Tax=Vibrio astriarenae TaxID=1481923 RepID=UPI003734CE37